MAKKVEKITAVRDGQTRKFASATWNAMPADKYGWERTTSNPPAVVSESLGKAGRAKATEQAGA